MTAKKEAPLFEEMDKILKDRHSYTASLAEGGTILPVTVSGEPDITAQIIVPIVSNGDCLGAIILLSKENGEKMGNNDLNLARLTAEILANQFE